MFKHQSVIHSGGIGLFLADLDKVFPALLEVLDLLLFENIGTCTGWTEVCIQRLAAPRCLDQKNGVTDVLLHGDAKG